jgi:hypothetical protein
MTRNFAQEDDLLFFCIIISILSAILAFLSLFFDFVSVLDERLTGRQFALVNIFSVNTTKKNFPDFFWEGFVYSIGVMLVCSGPFLLSSLGKYILPRTALYIVFFLGGSLILLGNYLAYINWTSQNPEQIMEGLKMSFIAGFMTFINSILVYYSINDKQPYRKSRNHKRIKKMNHSKINKENLVITPDYETPKNQENEYISSISNQIEKRKEKERKRKKIFLIFL